jgi:ribonuclease HI
MAAKKPKFYVVWEGRETGIYTDWSVAHPLVRGHAGAKFKSFESRELAEAAFKAGPAKVARRAPSSASKPVKNTAKIIDNSKDIHIFCDGGCDPNPGPSGSGLVVYQAGKLIEMHYGLFSLNGTNNTAELNALHQAMLIARRKSEVGLSVQILSDSVYSINAMTTWAKAWKARGWQKKTGELANRELIMTMYGDYLALSKNVNIDHVKGHSGVEGNELADRLSILAMRHKPTEFLTYDGLQKVPELLAM